ncbi:Brix domain-containing protein [Lineolata rhizophorae]|uniref:Brix domain-containing protein n=1 Tax=Lineolata rhizophorae TaxID=578093 RepID=A0A6A6NZP6_9PEZI|nr:Brix domain-containing protein [Lineolata rhizophorae]
MSAVYKSLSKPAGAKAEHASEGSSKNRQRVLILTSRGVTYRHRHLLNDLHALLPHSRKDSKLDTKTKLHQLNELADLYNCNNVLFLEARKGRDLYAWVAKPPNGPTAKLHLQNLHTMDELHFPGNCLRGSRPVLSFDAAFDAVPHTRLLKELLLHVFAVPRAARKSKPFVDHVMAFALADGRVWVRCYQIGETEDGASKGAAPRDTDISLVEIGPRFVLTPIVILEGSFGGPVIYENKEFVSPNQVRAELRRRRAGGFARRSEREKEGEVKRAELGLKTQGARKKRRDALDEKVLFA